MPEIRFVYQAPTAGAHQVGLAGDFSAWEILDLADLGGIYMLVLHIEQGKYHYKYIVDGIWLPDPDNTNQEPDPFGGLNSVLVVRSESAPRLSWHKVWQDPGLLDERLGHYLSLQRSGEHDYELRFFWHPGLSAEISVRLDGRKLVLDRLGRADGKEVYHCSFASKTPQAELLISISAEGKTLYLGAEGFSFEAAELSSLSLDLQGQPIFAVPDWVKDSVVYQIFPDRFYNGDRGLDPDFSEWYYADCRTAPPSGENLPPQVEYYHLVEDWTDITGLRQSPWLEPGKPDWWSFYGGDLPGVGQKLPYLQELGVSVIYFNPLWPAKSNHKYDAAAFKGIDPHFGSEQDLRELVQAAHALGIRVIVDVAFNHTGETFWAFRDCVSQGAQSRYWNWYDWKKWPLPNPLPPDFNPRDYYQCWWGIKDMPDLNYDLSRAHPAENYIRDITQAEPNRDLVDHILSCVRWWLAEMDIDGFRLDVPEEVPYWFWQLFRREVKRLKPQAWIVGEIWQSAQAWVGHRYFDSVMNYAYFKNPVLEFFILRLIDRTSFRRRVEEGLAQYPLAAIQAMMNLLGSHDTVRVLELARGDIARLQLALLFQLTFTGAPHIYYGDEIGMRGGKDPDNRRPFNWDWEQDPQALEVRDFYIRLIRLRHGQALLRQGGFAFLESPDGLLAWQRYAAEGRIVVAVNYSTVAHDFNTGPGWEILFQHGRIEKHADAFLLAPASGLILSFQAGKVNPGAGIAPLASNNGK